MGVIIKWPEDTYTDGTVALDSSFTAWQKADGLWHMAAPVTNNISDNYPTHVTFTDLLRSEGPLDIIWIAAPSSSTSPTDAPR
jgi:hypothetical protein